MVPAKCPTTALIQATRFLSRAWSILELKISTNVTKEGSYGTKKMVKTSKMVIQKKKTQKKKFEINEDTAKLRTLQKTWLVPRF